MYSHTLLELHVVGPTAGIYLSLIWYKSRVNDTALFIAENLGRTILIENSLFFKVHYPSGRQNYQIYIFSYPSKEGMFSQ